MKRIINFLKRVFGRKEVGPGVILCFGPGGLISREETGSVKYLPEFEFDSGDVGKRAAYLKWLEGGD